MSIYTRALRQDAVYWPPAGDGEDGKPTFGEAVPIKCRWVESMGQTIKVANRDIDSKANVNPDRDLEVGGILYKGKMSDLTPAQLADPFTFFQGWEIKTFTTVPNLKATKFWRVAVL